MSSRSSNRSHTVSRLLHRRWSRSLGFFHLSVIAAFFQKIVLLAENGAKPSIGQVQSTMPQPSLAIWSRAVVRRLQSLADSSVANAPEIVNALSVVGDSESTRDTSFDVDLSQSALDNSTRSVNAASFAVFIHVSLPSLFSDVAVHTLPPRRTARRSALVAVANSHSAVPARCKLVCVSQNAQNIGISVGLTCEEARALSADLTICPLPFAEAEAASRVAIRLCAVRALHLQVFRCVFARTSARASNVKIFRF